MIRRAYRALAFLLSCVLVLGAAAPSAASPTLSDIEDEVMCPTCGTALSLSESPLAQRQRALIQRLIDEGNSKAEIKARLVEELGADVLATPPRRGFSLTIYVVPLGAAALVLGALAVSAVRLRARGGGLHDEPAGRSFEDLVDADLGGRR